MATSAGVKLNLNQPFQTRFTHYTKAAFVTVLRAAFSDTATPAEYRWAPEEKDSKIGIYDSWPEREQQVNTIIVSIGSGSNNIHILGTQEYASEFVDNTNTVTHDTFTGEVHFNLTLTITSKKSEDRDRLTDICLIYTRHLIRTKLASVGLAFTQIGLGGEEQSEGSGNQILYTNTVNIDVMSVYEQVLPVSLQETVGNVNLAPITVLWP